MSDTKRPHVLIVGAGAMGILTGYHLELANAEVTFLVRPHRKPMLEKPQILYNYNDNELKEYKGLRCLTDPSEMVGQTYDYIVVTLDGNALRSEAGETLVKSLGEAARGKETKVILGAVAFNPLPWFLETSGLLDKQVTNGVLGIEVYPTNGVTLPVNPPTDPKLIAQADWAYVDCFGYGFAVTDHSPSVAEGFAQLYSASRVSRCVIQPAAKYDAEITSLFAFFAACNIMRWPPFKNIDTRSELWKTTIAAIKEIRGLGLYGGAGKAAANEVTEEGYAASLVSWGDGALPMDQQEFNRYHHGGKLNTQDRKILRDCLAYGESEGKPMIALKALIQRLEEPR